MTMTTMTTGRRRRRTSAVLGVILASSTALSAEADVQRTASDASDVSIPEVIDAKRHVSEKNNLRTLLTEVTVAETETISSDTPDLALDLGLDWIQVWRGSEPSGQGHANASKLCVVHQHIEQKELLVRLTAVIRSCDFLSLLVQSYEYDYYALHQHQKCLPLKYHVSDHILAY